MTDGIDNAPEVDFDQVSDENKFGLLPAGWYLVQVEKVEVEETADAGDFMLALQYKVIAGKYIGRYLFERISFGKAVNRAKYVLKNFGLPMTGRVPLDTLPALVIDQVAWVAPEIVPDNYKGRTGEKNEIPFWDGYKPATDDEVNAAVVASGGTVGGGSDRSSEVGAGDTKSGDDAIPF